MHSKETYLTFRSTHILEYEDLNHVGRMSKGMWFSIKILFSSDWRSSLASLDESKQRYYTTFTPPWWRDTDLHDYICQLDGRKENIVFIDLVARSLARLISIYTFPSPIICVRPSVLFTVLRHYNNDLLNFNQDFMYLMDSRSHDARRRDKDGIGEQQLKSVSTSYKTIQPLHVPIRDHTRSFTATYL